MPVGAFWERVTFEMPEAEAEAGPTARTQASESEAATMETKVRKAWSIREEAGSCVSRRERR